MHPLTANSSPCPLRPPASHLALQVRRVEQQLWDELGAVPSPQAVAARCGLTHSKLMALYKVGGEGGAGRGRKQGQIRTGGANCRAAAAATLARGMLWKQLALLATAGG